MAARDGRNPLRVAVLGAGGRGREAYGAWMLRHPDRARIVAVADAFAERRDGLADPAGVAAENRFDDWRAVFDAADRLRLDAVVIALPDREHVESALAAARLGLAVLLEKPAAPTAGELDRLATEGARLGARIAVGHVLRFTPFWQSLYDVVASGTIGRLVTIRLEENIGFWHFAHSFVRGNWRRTEESSPMVLSKTCHDLDLIRWFAGAAPVSVASSGSLTYFRPENAPAGAPARCLDGCPAADECPFYAPRYYAERLAHVDGWPVALLGPDVSPSGRLEALRTGPYGRCVFHSDNDVADHQQTIITFPDGLTVTLSTSSFTGQNTRTVRMTGTAGELAGHMESGEVTVDLFSPTAKWLNLPFASRVRESTREPMGHRVVNFVAAPPDADAGDHDGNHGGHAGGDDGLMDAFVTAVADETLGTSSREGVQGEGGMVSLESALDSHRIAFAAEESRRTGTVVPL